MSEQEFSEIASGDHLEGVPSRLSVFSRRPESASWSVLRLRTERSISDTITYFILVMSCLRANYVVFPISPRLSPAAIANLIHNAGVEYLLVGPAMDDLAAAAMQTLQNQYPDTATPNLFSAPSFDDLFTPDKIFGPGDLPYEDSDLDDVACLLHSSGKKFAHTITNRLTCLKGQLASLSFFPGQIASACRSP
jgi:acyl-CoA synthetase (AMP-forming)/AMP-acid ligase II